MSRSVDISVIIATRNRIEALNRSLKTLNAQTVLPEEIIIVDSSDHFCSHRVLDEFKYIAPRIQWFKAEEKGAAVQRNQGVEAARCSYILFMDDDAYLKTNVVEKLWTGIKTLKNAGAVNAMIKNQQYTPPGRLSRFMYRLMSGKRLDTYAGKLIGPAWNLLPEDRDDLPEYVPCEWLNTTCTLYKKESMPQPVFSSHFKGYSLMEDVTLSFFISRNYTLWNCRTARIYHDSQSGDHKNNISDLSEMELINRYYVMTTILQKKKVRDHLKLLAFELFHLFTSFYSHKSFSILYKTLVGKWKAFRKL